ncbi:Similar to phosphoglycolate phosphatase,clustered with ribosomal large subunit pseudouridine synthase C [Pseudoalteromonas luteoviolacea B = ATCC 29581]|nr:Similar to phosphoglycolate phosphatase,clustered with ribosomal large subunit pseudouridine synthase C [Pseudoalteromonas luteoviolacea B = ATCC 29581]
MKYKLVIFDWDGTVMDSIEKIVNSIQLAAEHAGVDIPTADAAKRIIGLSLETAIETLFPNERSKWHALVTGYKHQFKYMDKTPTPVFEGVEALLGSLSQQGIKLAVATGKSRAGLNRMLEQSGLGHYFVVTKTADEAQSKPHPQMLNDILSETNVAPKDAVMIGDTIIDMQLACNAKVDAIGVTLGVDSTERLLENGAYAVANNYTELGILLSLQNIKSKFA